MGNNRISIEYLERHPNATDQEAYEATADRIDDRYRDNFADMVDRAKDRAKDEGRWPPKGKAMP